MRIGLFIPCYAVSSDFAKRRSASPASAARNIPVMQPTWPGAGFRVRPDGSVASVP
jgi:hypothetical protein